MRMQVMSEKKMSLAKLLQRLSLQKSGKEFVLGQGGKPERDTVPALGVRQHHGPLDERLTTVRPNKYEHQKVAKTIEKQRFGEYVLKTKFQKG